MIFRVKRLAVAILFLSGMASMAEAKSPGTPSVETGTNVRWQHPAGLVTDETIAEIKTKLATQDWARKLYEARRRNLKPWLEISSAELKAVFPKKRGNVYHNFSCPQDRCRLTFDPFNASEFKCPLCGKVFAPETDAGVYTAKDRYHATMYDGWICLFHLAATDAVTDLGVFSRSEATNAAKYADRAIELLMLYADVIEKLKTKVDPSPQMNVLLTYHREGDNKILDDLAIGYELVRDRMTPEQRSRFERVVLQRMLDDLMLERIYTYDHNNVYQWHRTIIQTGLALERADLIDWSFGFGKWDDASEPEHRSVRRILAKHFKPDGAFWEMCSGYHLYPLSALCELAVVSRHLSNMDANRFPADRYDLTNEQNPGYQVIRNSLHWFMSLAPPDRIMPTIGDSMAPRAGMADYFATAEAGYRFYGLKAVGDYPELREGKRTWAAMLYGAPQIVESPEPCTSSYLSSGWVSLRNEWQGNRVWVGLNALIPGGGHQHADRLGLLSFSQGQLLALEKATPYNESVTRVLGTLSPSHNTVTVDMTSQKQGEALKGDEIPKVAYFVTSPIAQFAEIHGDHIYPQTRVYRRSVALIEDFYVDFFRVEGGTNFDWMLHHAGTPTKFSVPMSDGSFTPADWLTNGSGRIQQATADGTWEATWTVSNVTARITMLGAKGTQVYGLETYPLDNAIVTSRNPPCQTVCVRRQNDGAFMAVGDAWSERPNVQFVVVGEGARGLKITSRSHTYHLRFGAGRVSFPDGVSLAGDTAFVVVCDTNALVLAAGTKLDLGSGAGSLSVVMDKRATLFAKWANGKVRQEISNDVQFDTFGGVDHPRPAPDVTVKVSGTLWPTP